MASKKTIAGVIILAVLIISAGILIPVLYFTYQSNKEEEEGFKFSGLFTEVTTINIGLGMFSGSSISSSASYNPGILSNSTSTSWVPIEFYALNQLGGPGFNPSQLLALYDPELATIMSVVQSMIDIQLDFNLTGPPPENTTLSYQGSVWGLLGSNFNIQAMFDANTLRSLNGTIHLDLFMDISINLSFLSTFGFEIPELTDINFNLTLSMDFNVTL